MKISTRLMSAVLIAGSSLFASSAFAQAPNCEDPRVDRAACYREAAAAQEMKRRGLPESRGNYAENALKRCLRHPEGKARQACEKRVLGKGNTTTRGSVKGGGKIRRNEMPVPPPAAAPAAPAAPAQAPAPKN